MSERRSVSVPIPYRDADQMRLVQAVHRDMHRRCAWEETPSEFGSPLVRLPVHNGVDQKEMKRYH